MLIPVLSSSFHTPLNVISHTAQRHFTHRYYYFNVFYCYLSWAYRLTKMIKH